MNTFEKSENPLIKDARLISGASTLEAAVPLALHESIIAEQKMRMKEQQARIDEQALLVAQLKMALELKSNQAASSAKQRTISIVQKISGVVASQIFWAAMAPPLGLTLPASIAFYKGHRDSLWGMGPVTLYAAACSYVVYLMARYAFRSLQKAYRSGPVAFCNTLFVYGAIIALAGVMETLSSLSRGQSGSLTGMIITGLLVCGGSFGFGKRKTAGHGERFPDLQAARRFI